MDKIDLIPDKGEGFLLVEDPLVITGLQMSKMPSEQRAKYDDEIETGKRVRINSDAYMLHLRMPPSHSMDKRDGS